ncbi:MAG: hypothetical protein U0326_20700 [Polyangiales bacterium]
MSSRKTTSAPWPARGASSASSRSPSTWPRSSRASPASSWALETLASFQKILSGKYDDLERYLRGNIDDVKKRAAELAKSWGGAPTVMASNELATTARSDLLVSW